MTLQEFLDKTSAGHIFTINFTKRTNGEVRTMNCRRGVARHLHGGQLAFDPAKHNLLTVFDMQKQGYRMVNLDDLHWLNLDGHAYVWEGGEFKEM